MTVSPSIDTLDRVSTVDFQYDFHLAGQAEPNTTIAIEQSGVGVLGNTNVDALGHWQFDVQSSQPANGKFEYTVSSIPQPGEQSLESSPVQYRPNIVLINVDDMRKDQLPYLQFLTSLSDEATTFQNAFTPTSVSGPSRASLMTGLLPMHHGYLANTESLGLGINLDLRESLPVWLADEGYRTGLFGKDRTLPVVDAEFASQDIMAPAPGWSTYFAGISRGPTGYGTGFSDNGVLYTAGINEYSTDVLSNRLLQFTDASHGSDPFFAYFAPYAPHGPGTPATRHDHLLDGFQPTRAPSFLVKEPDQLPITQGRIDKADFALREGNESLAAIDEAIAALYQQLSEQHLLDNTVIMFTSDNGYMYGEHGFIQKNMFWEESIRVPLMIWDGRVRVGQSTDSLATTVDISRTIVDLAGAESRASSAINQDGFSLMPVVLDANQKVRDDFYMEHHGSDMANFGVHTEKWVYAESESGRSYLFDVLSDPYQLNNLFGNPDYAGIQLQLQNRLQSLRSSDRQAPVLDSVQWNPTIGLYTEPQKLQLTIVINDTLTGNSQVRSPALTFDPVDPTGKNILLLSGESMESTDGIYDSSIETAAYAFPIPELYKSTGPELYISIRDIVGNFSALQPLQIPFDPAPVLQSADDTGESNVDRVSLITTPTFGGQALPGERIALFAGIEGSDTFTLQGTAVADNAGKWSATLNLTEAGRYIVYGQKIGPAGSTSSLIKFLSPTSYYLLANTVGNQVFMVGTNDDDRLQAQINGQNNWEVLINGVSAGALPPQQRLNIGGLLGDDRLEVIGNIPSRLAGSFGDDLLIGGTAADILIPGTGTNESRGGPGNDEYIFLFTDAQMASQSVDNDLIDKVIELPGEGTDQLTFNGPFVATTKLGLNAPNPKVELTLRYAQPRQVLVNSPANFERIDGTAMSADWNVPLNIVAGGTSQDDTIHVSGFLELGKSLTLSSLTVGKNANFTGDVTTRFESNLGQVQLSRALLPGLTLVASGPSFIELSGSVDLINAFLLRNGVVVATTGVPNRSTIEVTAITHPVSDTQVVQTDTMIVHVQLKSRITGLTPQTYVENSPAILLATKAQATFTAPAVANGVLSVSALLPGELGDRIFVRAQGVGPNKISVSGNNVSYGDVLIGEIVSDGKDGSRLAIQLSQSATSASVLALIRRISFQSVSDAFESAVRQFEIAFVDNSLNVTSGTVAVDIVAQNDAPVMRITPATPISYVAGTTGFVTPIRKALVSDAEQKFSGGQLQIEFLGYFDSGDQLRIAPKGDGFGQVNIVGSQVKVSGVVIGSLLQNELRSPITITWNNRATAESIALVIARLQYRSIRTTPVTTQRNIRITLTDSEGAQSVGSQLINFV